MAVQHSLAGGIVIDEAAFLISASQARHRLNHDGALTPDVRGLEPGALEVDELLDETKPTLGLFVIDGLIAVELSAGQAGTAWLVGAEDLVRPQQTGDIPLIQRARWQVLTPTRVLVLTGGVAERARRSAVLLERLLTSAMRTTHWLLARSLVMSLRGITDRLLLLFALWGERWGRVTPEGIWLELPITHRLIGECCGTRRPSVTTGLRVLHDKGLILRAGRRDWLLRLGPTASGTNQSCALARSALGFGLTDGSAPRDRVGSPQ